MGHNQCVNEDMVEEIQPINDHLTRQPDGELLCINVPSRKNPLWITPATKAENVIHPNMYFTYMYLNLIEHNAFIGKCRLLVGLKTEEL